MNVKWEIVKIFISSIFDDMHAERDYFVKQIFRNCVKANS